jgi:hypothetical protein
MREKSLKVPAARQRHSDQVTRNATIGSTVIARRAGT